MPSARRLIPIATAIAVALLAAPGVASAQLVFDRGNDIWAANDDGSNPHLLVQAAPLGMDAGLGSPAVAPAGDTLLFRGTTFRTPYVDHGLTFYGENTDGAYALQGGTVRRLSGPPAALSMPSTTGDIVPEPAPGGAYVYERGSCTDVWDPITFGYARLCGSELRSSTLAAGAAGSARFTTPCDEEAEGGPADPSPDPAAGSGLVAYVGCMSEGPGGFRRGELILGGPGGTGATTIAYGPEEPNSETIAGFAGYADPSWSPDGSRIVAYDYGGAAADGVQEAGIDVFGDLSGPSAGRLVVHARQEEYGAYETLASPRFAGPSTIVFVAAGSVWSVPASCDECSFPGPEVKLLVPGGSTAAEQAFSVAWTEGEVAPASVYPGQEQGGGSSPGGHRGAAPSSPASRPGPHGNAGQGRRAGALALTLARIHAPRLNTLLAKGLPVAARCSRRCTLALTLRERSGRRSVVVGRAKVTLRPRRLTTVRVHFTARARHALRHARRLKLRLAGVARARGLAPARASRTVRVRR
jgi:hypothetical protein